MARRSLLHDMREPGFLGKRLEIEKEFVILGLIGSGDEHVPSDGDSVVRRAGQELRCSWFW